MTHSCATLHCATHAGHASTSVAEAVRYSEESRVKCIGLTIETRPDYCLGPHLRDMLSYGCTRLEIGLQVCQCMCCYVCQYACVQQHSAAPAQLQRSKIAVLCIAAVLGVVQRACSEGAGAVTERKALPTAYTPPH
jgi:hypothetical protein